MSSSRMPNLSGSDALQDAARACETLRTWLVGDAYTLWWTRGADHVRGGFHESLDMTAGATDAPRRGRLHPRQMWSFALAGELGWSGPGEAAVRHALDYFVTRYRRPDRLYRSLVAADGTVLSDDVVLYDQAFALLGLAAAYDMVREDHLREDARELLRTVRRTFGHAHGSCRENGRASAPVLANPHMHLLEAALAWIDLDDEALWRDFARGLVELALTRFIDREHGFLREFFDEQLRPMPGELGLIVEPGHQFEWAWLLLSWHSREPDARTVAAALRLIESAERFGVDRARGVAVNCLLADGAVKEQQARLWPQTERIKAACSAAIATGDRRYWRIATAAANALQVYLRAPISGLWYDKMETDGRFVQEPVPASSFYHLTTAITVFGQAVTHSSATRLS